MMRECPRHVLAALRRYDPELGMQWDDRSECWYFMYEGKKAFVFKHPDGGLVMEPYAEEAVAAVRAADNRVHGGFARLKMLERARAERLARAAEEDREEWAGARREGEAITDVFRRGGAKPFVEVHERPAAMPA